MAVGGRLRPVDVVGGGALVKKTPIGRREPLVARNPLSRNTPLQRSKLTANVGHHTAAPKRRSTIIPRSVRAGLARRSGGVCEVAQPGCTGAATDLSHRIRVGMGGRHGAAALAHHVLSNMLHACRWCHGQRLHANPREAYAAGWMLREGQTPARHRVLYRGSWRWLDDQGAVLVSPSNAHQEAS